jgi:hypothetical protein
LGRSFGTIAAEGAGREFRVSVPTGGECDVAAVVESLRLPSLYRKVCLRAGVPLPPGRPSADRFVVRTGSEPPGLFAALLEEAFLEDEAEAPVLEAGTAPELAALEAGTVAVQAGLERPCPDAEGLRRAACPDGRRWCSRSSGGTARGGSAA